MGMGGGVGIQKFDIEAYAKLPKTEKLKSILDFAGINNKGLAQILGANDASVELLLIGDDFIGTRELVESADMLISVLFYALETARYNNLRYIRYLDANSFFKNSLNKPPWEKECLSLRNYLIRDKRKAIQESLTWIRSH